MFASSVPWYQERLDARQAGDRPKGPPPLRRSPDNAMWAAGSAGRVMSVEASEHGRPVPGVAADASWLDALRARDEEAWRQLHEREFAFLYRYAIAVGADETLAEDAVSEAFTRLVKTLPRLRIASPVALRSWLLVVCRNYVRDQQRRRKRDTARLADAPTATDPDLTARPALAAALARLPEAQREVVVLRFVTGLSTSEIAALGGRGVGAVESLQHRALTTLRRHFGLAPGQ